MRAPGKPPLERRNAEPSTGSARLSPLLELHKVSKRFGGVLALREVGFTVAGGEIVGLIGPNGSGKTTLLNLISGLYPTDEGRLVFAGEDIGAARPFQIARRGIGRSFQRIGLVDEMSAIDNVAVAYAGRTDRPPWFIASFSGEPLTTARTRALRQLDALGIAQHAWERADVLPQGVRRKVEIARALALSPRLLLLDEPAAGLTPAEMTDLAARLRVLSAQGLALLVVEHNMTFLLPLAERVVCLDGGAMIAEGSPQEIRSNAAVLAAYLGTDPAP
jgi:ABC-type branched-subunit amino acid transport system ATPase component